MAPKKTSPLTPDTGETPVDAADILGQVEGKPPEAAKAPPPAAAEPPPPKPETYIVRQAGEVMLSNFRGYLQVGKKLERSQYDERDWKHILSRKTVLRLERKH